jgi:N-acetylgalactosamine-6-sulfatase
MIKRSSSTFYAYLIFLCVLVSGAWAVKKTNFVFIYADDLGFGDLACYGHPYAKTPALDKLAREGTRFTQAYAGGQTCNPARTAIMTGMFPPRFAKGTGWNGFGDRVTVTELTESGGLHDRSFWEVAYWKSGNGAWQTLRCVWY